VTRRREVAQLVALGGAVLVLIWLAEAGGSARVASVLHPSSPPARPGATATPTAAVTPLLAGISPPPRLGAAMFAPLGDPGVLMFGGQDSTSRDTCTSDLWHLDGAGWTRRAGMEQLPCFEPHEMFVRRTQSTVVVAQRCRGCDLETWTSVLGSATWTRYHGLGPGEREGYAAAADVDDDILLVFGGAGRDDSWAWDGAGWTRLNPRHHPPARSAAAMAATLPTGHVLLFGGVGTARNFADTWLWTGSDWTEAHPAQSPPARDSASVVFDPPWGNILVGGVGQGTGGPPAVYPQLLSDAWIWNGKTWTPAPSLGRTAGPAPPSVSLPSACTSSAEPTPSTCWRTPGSTTTAAPGCSCSAEHVASLAMPAAPVLNTQLDLTDEQRAVRDLARDLCESEVKPHAAAWDENHLFPYDAVAKMGELGFFGLGIDERYGGSGADFVSLCLAIEELSRGDTGLGITLEAAVGLGISPIYRFGTDAQKEKYLPDLCAGRRLWAFGLTEPHAGSDAGSTRTRARLDNGEWVISGSKAFITNSGTDISWGVSLTAVTGDGDGGRKEISTIMVENGTSGYLVEPPYRKLGWHSSDTHGLTFDECRVPEANLLGTRGKGYAQFLSTLEAGRIAIAALSVGLAQACLDESLEYAKNRTSFGVPIAKHQAIQFKLADMAMETHLARLAVYHAARLWDAGRPCHLEAAAAKLFASETSKRAADQAIQIHGGMGFMEESPVARYWRDVKVNEIGEGTSEVQRMLIAKQLGA